MVLVPPRERKSPRKNKQRGKGRKHRPDEKQEKGKGGEKTKSSKRKKEEFYLFYTLGFVCVCNQKGPRKSLRKGCAEANETPGAQKASSGNKNGIS